MKIIQLVKYLSVPFLFMLTGLPMQAADNFFAELQKQHKPDQILVYKEVGGVKLNLHVFHPKGFKPTDKRPVFIAIHGGGWVGGDPERFYPYANWLVDEGFVGISVQYRLVRQGTTVFDCVKDGRAAVRYVRAHAKMLGINPESVVVSGGSAGGHVAAGTALFDGVDHEDEDTSTSCRPNALILLFPVIDTSEKGYGQKRIGKDWQALSPVHNVKAGLPPTLIFHGAIDTVTPLAGSESFKNQMVAKGNACELVVDPKGSTVT